MPQPSTSAITPPKTKQHLSINCITRFTIAFLKLKTRDRHYLLWSASQPQNKPSPNGENQDTIRQGNSLEEEDRNQRVLTPSANLLTIDIKEITSGSLENKCKVFR
jgi:hypothetical protein